MTVFCRSTDGVWVTNGKLLNRNYTIGSSLQIQNAVDITMRNTANAIEAEIRDVDTLYVVLQIPIDKPALPELMFLDRDSVDALIDLHETSFTDFPVENGVRVFQDNQYDYVVSELGQHDTIEEDVVGRIESREQYFDEFVMNSNANWDSDERKAVSAELDSWRAIEKILENIG